MNTPETIDWFVTSKCNLKCDFCYGPYPEIENRKIIKDIAYKISESNVANVTLCGGEPFVNPDIFEIIDILIDNGKNVYVSSNGHFPIKILRVLDKLSGVSISLDSYDKKNFEKIRGNLSDFDKVIESIKIISSENPNKLKITTVLSSLNINSMVDIGNFILEYNPKIWRILKFVPRMKGSLNRGIYEISDNDFSKSIDELNLFFSDLKIYASKEEEINSCFLIDHRGNIILPRNDIYDIVGNCFNKSIEECWEKYWKSKKIHYRNKIWMSEIKK
nr:radical SAM protein [uncultured Psychrobacter sp.]